MLVRPKEGIRDPQGHAVERLLRQLGSAVADARVGRIIDVEVDATSADEARAEVEPMRAPARQPADRELRDRAGTR